MKNFKFLFATLVLWAGFSAHAQPTRVLRAPYTEAELRELMAVRSFPKADFIKVISTVQEVILREDMQTAGAACYFLGKVDGNYNTLTGKLGDAINQARTDNRAADLTRLQELEPIFGGDSLYRNLQFYCVGASDNALAGNRAEFVVNGKALIAIFQAFWGPAR